MAAANNVGRSARSPRRQSGPPRPVAEGDLGSLVANRYWLQELIGRGGEGDTFRAEDRIGGGTVAVKMFRGEAATLGPRVIVEFERLVGMDHPGVVRALDLGRHDQRLFLVTALVEGESIGAIAAIPDEARRRRMFARAARELTDAVAYLHGRGVIHGDISPQNVRMTPDGRCVLIDLGATAVTLSSEGARGTLGFAAPEALIGCLSPAADLFSLGATLFHAWTGGAPFGVGIDSITQMLSQPAPLLSAVRGGLAPGWDALLSGLLRAAPEERTSSARAALRAIHLLTPWGEDSGGPAGAGEGGPVPGGDRSLLAPHPAGDPLAGIFVGRTTERALLKEAFAALADGASPRALICVVGRDGSGRRTLVELALRDLAVAQVRESASPLAIFRGSLAALAAWLGPQEDSAGGRPLRPGSASDAADDPVRGRQRWFAALAHKLEQRAAQFPLLVSLSSGSEAAAFAAFIAGAPASGRLLLLIADSAAIQGVAAADITLPPLAFADVSALVNRATGEETPPPAVNRIVAASGGHAAAVAVLARQLVEATRRGEADRFAPEPNLAVEELLDQSFRALPAAARQFVARMALGVPLADPPPVDQVVVRAVGSRRAQTQAGEGGGERYGEAEDTARAGGWIAGEGEERRLPSLAHRAAFRRLFSHPDVHEVARQALAAPELLPHPLEDGARGFCLEVIGDPTGATAAFQAAAADDCRAKESHRPGPAIIDDDTAPAGWLAEAARLAPGMLNVDQRTSLATALVLRGRAGEASALLDGGSTGPGALSDESVTSPAAARDRLRLAERKAWLLGRAGQVESACALLQTALTGAPSAVPSDIIDGARARLARLFVSGGRFEEAVAMASVCAASSAARPLAMEAAVLGHAYGGDLPAARRLLGQWAGEVRATKPPGPASARDAAAPRLSYLAALLDHLAGDLLSALDSYQRAMSDAEEAGDIHTLAAVVLNRGALAAEAGRYVDALAMQERAIRELGRLGAHSELATALFNAAMTLLELGDTGGARAQLSRLQDESARRLAFDDQAHARSIQQAVIYLRAELAMRQGDEPAALVLFTQIESDAAGVNAAVAPASTTGLRRAALLARAELLARGQRLAEASGMLDDLRNAAAGGVPLDPRAAAELRLAEGRILVCAPALDLASALTCAAGLQEDAHAARRAGRLPRAWRAALMAARLFHRGGRMGDAAAQITVARGLFQEIRMSTPIDHRSGLENDPDARFLHELARLSAGSADAAADNGHPRPSRAEDRLRRLLRINKRLNGELRLPRLLELIMDTIIELTEAERGFILLEDDKGELTVKVARNIDQQSLQAGAFDLSRSIARQAATGGAPIVTIDAAGDPRFREALSVSDLHLRSVLAVPLQVKGRAVGTLYVDHRLRKGAFGEDDVQLVLDFAEQAAIAIENARLLGELRRRERQIEVLNRRLQTELALRKEELVGMKQELRENREALAIRYDYRNIVGRTPRMLDLFRLLDRLTDTALPVVIQGESGTGKELVARALHFNGPRRDRPFVSENCAAIPETLLESTLFGAVRGAYTGADHDSRGLFEVADGGTLFLDEVGEMSPAMQGKLLRVLQTGELRRVGSERIRKVEVRVVAATNRDLGRMVEDGRFRQDLFFRLCVAPIALPPLRDRRDDIPAIVEHVMSKLSATTATAPKRVTAAALARLTSYRWPGNVRELENELMRAAALCEGVVEVRDLSPHIAGDAETALTTLEDPDNLALRPRVERLERALLREALGRSGGNQTRAAVALGLSRFGLQKKMQRYHIG